MSVIYKYSGCKWILRRQRESIQKASSQTSTVDDSISCISLRVEGLGDLSLLVVSAEWADIGAWPSSIMGHGTYIVFHGLLGQCMISRTHIQHVYGDTLPIPALLVTLIPHVSNRPSAFSSLSTPASNPSPHSLISFLSRSCTSKPSFCFSIRMCLLISWSFPLHLYLHPLICPPRFI